MFKKKIREIYLNKRKCILNRKKKEKRIINKIQDLDLDKEQILSGYYPFSSEVNILPLLEFLVLKKFSICLPFILKKNFHLVFKKWTLNCDLIDGRFKIKVPNNEIILTPSVLLVPLVAFDIKKNRLGYGGGYYDRTIKYLGKKKVFTIGVAFDEQEIEKVPTMQYDEKLDLIVTQTRVIK